MFTKSLKILKASLVLNLILWNTAAFASCPYKEARKAAAASNDVETVSRVSAAEPPKESAWSRLTGGGSTNTGDPQRDLANLRIKAGRARLEALKSKERLEDHIAKTSKRTEELTLDAEKANKEAEFLENEVKLQESSVNSAR